MRIAILMSDSREVNKTYNDPLPSFGTAPAALLEGFEMLADKVEVHVLSCLQTNPHSSPSRLAGNIFYHPLHVPKIGWIRTGYQGCVRASRRKLREIKPDIVHGQGTERDCAMSAVFSGFPNILTIHGVMRAIYDVTASGVFDYYWFAKHLETLALGRTDGVVSISPYVNRLISPLTRRTWFVPNAVQLFFFAGSHPRPRRSGPIRFVNVGVISNRKRQVELLERLAHLRESVVFQMTFVGKTSRRSTYTNRFRVLLNSLNTRYGGFTHHEFLSEDAFLSLYNDSDAMIHFSNEESFGLTFAEALARNLPLFASDVGGIRQIADGIPICQIFAVDDFHGLMSGLRDWLDGFPHGALRDGAPNAEIASRYHPKVIAERHLNIYEQVLAHRS